MGPDLLVQLAKTIEASTCVLHCGAMNANLTLPGLPHEVHSETAEAVSDIQHGAGPICMHVSNPSTIIS